METSVRQAPQGRLALWIALAAAIASLLTMASPASGQESPAVGATQPPAAPVAEAAPEIVPVEATPEVAAVAEEAAAAAPPPPSSSPSAPPPPAPAPAPEDRPVSDLVAKTVENTSEAVTKTQVAEELPGSAAQVVKRATELSSEAQARVIEIVAATEKAVLPALPLPGDAPAGPAAPTPDQPLPLHQAPVSEELLTGVWLGYDADGPGGLPTSDVAGAAAIDLLRAGTPSGLSELRAAFYGTDFFTGTVRHFNQPASSPSSPGFPPSLTTDLGAPGSGATFFVPIAALLALLALASPAILRRLRELPDFPAPTPFVCALERPG